MVDADTPIRASEMSSFRAPTDITAMQEAGGLDQLIADLGQINRRDSVTSESSAGG